MPDDRFQRPRVYEHGGVVLAILIFAILITVFAYWLSQRNRADSLAVLVDQGRAFTESLSIAARSTALGQASVERLLRERFHLVASELSALPTGDIEESFPRFRERFQIEAAIVYTLPDRRASYELPEEGVLIPVRVQQAVADLMLNPDSHAILYYEVDSANTSRWFYAEVSNRLDQLILLAADATEDRQRLEVTGLGTLVTQLGNEAGIQYVLYQTPQGIVASSKEIDSLPAIAADPFLSFALEADSISYRMSNDRGVPIVELVRPFQAGSYPFGLLRVALSLEQHERIAATFDRQLAVSTTALFLFAIAALLFVVNRRQRLLTGQEYARYRSLTEQLFEQVNAGIAVVDSAGRVQQFNSAMQALVLNRLTIGSSWPEDGFLAGTALGVFLHSASESDERELSVTIDRRTARLLVLLSKIHQDQNTPLVVIVATDVSSLRTAEAEAQRRARLAELGNLAAGVAHEIRNPLNTISIAAQRLAGEFSPTEQTEQYAAITRQIREETRRVNDSITRFLGLSRQSHSVADQHATCDLNDIVEELAVLWRLESAVKGQQIELVLDRKQACRISISSENARAVLTNFYLNSRDALEGRSGTIQVNTSRSESGFTLSFEDSGGGVSPEKADRVFEPYYTTKEKGTGLGLSIVRQLVHESGGEITAKHSPLGGAAFCIYWPANRIVTS